MANVLCVVAHPDDEVLGCGGTLHKHSRAGDDAHVAIIVGRGLEGQAHGAREWLGVKRLTIKPLSDQKLDTYPFTALVAEVEDLGGQPDIVYTHNPDDLNLDHALTARAVLTAFRAFHGTILAFETISSTEFGTPFQPDWYEALSEENVQAKIRALECYPSEIREQPHPRNALGVRNRAALRGDEACVEYAEAFRLLRRINA